LFLEFTRALLVDLSQSTICRAAFNRRLLAGEHVAP
jgi:hypothetical protein